MVLETGKVFVKDVRKKTFGAPKSFCTAKETFRRSKSFFFNHFLRGFRVLGPVRARSDPVPGFVVGRSLPVNSGATGKEPT